MNEREKYYEVVARCYDVFYSMEKLKKIWEVSGESTHRNV